jgi:hypothetical protein
LRNEAVVLLASPERSPKDACVAYDPSPTGPGVPDAKGRRPATHTTPASNLVECRLSLLQRDGVVPGRTLEHREARRQVFELKHESPRIGRGTGSTRARDHHKRGDNDHHPTFLRSHRQIISRLTAIQFGLYDLDDDEAGAMIHPPAAPDRRVVGLLDADEQGGVTGFDVLIVERLSVAES